MSFRLFRLFLPALSLAATVGLAQNRDVPLTNWTVPAYRANGASGGLTTMSDVTPGVGFVGVAPCRLVDTRQAGFPAGYGPPSLTQGSPRNFDLNSDPQCTGIPAGVDAYSLNITVTNTQGPGFILIYPQGGSQPTVSTVNYVAGQTIANAAIVPAGTNGGVTVIAGVSGTDLVIDINGYFTDQYNTGVSFHAVSAAPYPGATLIAENTSTAAGAMAIQGVITSTAAGSSSVAVRGINNNNSNNNGIGVFGSHAGAGWGVLGQSQTGLGVFGQTFGSIGIGVVGDSASTALNDAGVFGQGNGSLPIGICAECRAAGVHGRSLNGSGVLGVSNSAHAAGVTGIFASATGDEIVNSLAFLGWNATTGVYAQNNITKGGTVNFTEPHATDASKKLTYVALEGNEVGTYFRGRGRFQNGIATINVPEDFRMVTQPEDLSIQVTPIGEMASVAVASIGLDRIVVRGSRNVEFFYTVNGIRRGYDGFSSIGENDKDYIPASPDAVLALDIRPEIRERLIRNGTYKPDGTVNMETARRLGWDKEWEKRKPPATQPTSN